MDLKTSTYREISVRLLCFLMGIVFLLSSYMKAVNIYSFAQTIDSFSGLLGLNTFYGYGVHLAILVCACECLMPLLSISLKYRGVVIWCYPFVLALFVYITYVNLTDLYGGIESCGCFGELIHLSPAASFYKNIVLLGFSLFLLVSYLEAQRRANSPLFPLISIDRNLFVALLVSIIPSLFSLLCLNKMPQTAYLSLFILLCITSLGVSVISIMRKVS